MSQESTLLGACIEGDEPAVARHLARDPALARARDPGIESTPLHFAAHRGYAGIVARLLEAGADVEAREGASGTTALHWAAEGGHVPVIQALLGAGAALDVVDDWHALPPVDWASVVRHAPPFHADRPAAAAYLEAQGSAPGIFSAVVRESKPLVHAIVERDPTALTRRLGPADAGMQPLHVAIRRGLDGIAQDLIELGAPTDALTARGETPRSLATLRSPAALAALERRGVPDDIPSALARRDWAGAELLLQTEPGSLRSPHRYAPLLAVAARRGAVEVVNWLLAHGAEPGTPMRVMGFNEWLTDLTPIHLAAEKGHAEVVDALARQGADVNATGPVTRVTPLHLAAWEGHLETVRTLLAVGADRTLSDTVHHATPLGWAEHGEHRAVAELLRG